MQELISALTSNGLIIINQTLIDTYLEKEKEQIMDAFVRCWILNIPDGTECKISGKEYFDLTYNQNK